MTRSQQTRTPRGEKSKKLLPLLCGCLWAAVTVSAIGVVYSTFAARQATAELEDLRREASSLQVVSGQYLLEKSTLASYTRVEVEAEKKLDMQVPPVESLQVVHH